MEDDDWSPWRIRLSIPLMWSLLKFDVSPSSEGASFAPTALRHTSPIRTDVSSPDSILEINVAMSPPVVTVDPVVGHNSCLLPYMTNESSTPEFSDCPQGRDIAVPPADSLMFNTPWLWTGNSQLTDFNMGAGYEPNLTADEGFSTWWDFGCL